MKSQHVPGNWANGCEFVFQKYACNMYVEAQRLIQNALERKYSKFCSVTTIDVHI